MNQSTTITKSHHLGKLKHTILPASQAAPLNKLKSQVRKLSPNIKRKLIQFSTERDTSTVASSVNQTDQRSSTRKEGPHKKVHRESASETTLRPSKLVNLVEMCESQGIHSFSILKAASKRIHK